MLTEWNPERLLQYVSRQYDTGTGFRKSASDHGSAFPGGGVTAAPVEGAEFFKFRWPGLCKIAEQCSPKTRQSR